MNRGVLGALVAVGAVIVLALLARATSRDESVGGPTEDGLSEGASPPPEGHDAGEGEDEDDWEEVEVVAVTSDGFALVPDAHAVRLVPPHEEGEAWKAGTTGHSARGQRALDMSWHAGDFTGARVVPGAADEGPWRFEGLGRDGEYTAFVFETREGADAALGVFQSRGVIRLGRDDDGNEVPPSPEQFAEARRIYLETEAALESSDE